MDEWMGRWMDDSPMDKYGEFKHVTLIFFKGNIYGLQRQNDTLASAYVGKVGVCVGFPFPNVCSGLNH